MKVGITGESGFIGRRLSEAVKAEGWHLQPFEDEWFTEEEALVRWASECDTIVHLAARNRPTDDPATYATNVRLTERLIAALAKTPKTPAILYASSIREGDPTAFGRSKRACRERLEAYFEPRGGRLTTLRIPNVFGPGARAFDNSFIATFSWQLIHGEEPVVTEDRLVPLVHVDSLARQIVAVLRGERAEVAADFRMSVPEVLAVLRGFWAEFQKRGTVSIPPDRNSADLRATFLSYLD